MIVNNIKYKKILFLLIKVLGIVLFIINYNYTIV